MTEETTRMLSDIRERVVRVETKIDSMTDVRATADKAKAMAGEALHYGRTAHEQLNEIKDNQRWLWRTVIGGLLTGAISILWRLWGKG